MGLLQQVNQLCVNCGSQSIGDVPFGKELLYYLMAIEQDVSPYKQESALQKKLNDGGQLCLTCVDELKASYAARVGEIKVVNEPQVINLQEISDNGYIAYLEKEIKIAELEQKALTLGIKIRERME